jgi:hypothetical protein
MCGAPGECNCFADEEDADHDDHEHEEHNHCQDQGCCGSKSKKKESKAVAEKPEPVTATVEELSKMSIKELRNILMSFDVDISDCVEKRDLVKKVDEFCREVPEEKDQEEEEEEMLDENGEVIPKLVSEEDGEDEDDDEEYEDEDEDMEDIEMEDSLDMTLVRPAKAKEELYNTYGDHPNSSLLSRYGFTETENPFDVVRVGPGILAMLVERLGKERVEERLMFWKEVGRKVVGVSVREFEKAMMKDEEDDGDEDDMEYDDEEDEEEEDDDEEDDDEDNPLAADEGDFHFESDGSASPQLMVFLHLMFLENKAFATFSKNAETLHKYVDQVVGGGDDSWKVASKQPKRSTGKKATPNKPNTTKTSQSPLVKSIHSFLASAIEVRGKRYLEASVWTGEERAGGLSKKQLDALPNGPKKWALILRQGELEVLKRSFVKYSKK